MYTRPTAPSYIDELRDKEQTDREKAQFESGIPVFTDQVTRVVAKGKQTGAQRVMHDPTVGQNNIGRNAGVVIPHDAKPGLFVGDKQGRR